MEITKKWSLLQHLMNILWALHTKLTQLIDHILLESTAQDQTLLPGTICIHTEMISIQTEELTMEINTTANRSNRFSSGPCMTQDI